MTRLEVILYFLYSYVKFVLAEIPIAIETHVYYNPLAYVQRSAKAGLAVRDKVRSNHF